MCVVWRTRGTDGLSIGANTKFDFCISEFEVNTHTTEIRSQGVSYHSAQTTAQEIMALPFLVSTPLQEIILRRASTPEAPMTGRCSM